MSLLTVYRVEDALGHGPYFPNSDFTNRQKKIARNLASRHSDAWYIYDQTVESSPDIHPGPTEDPGMALRWKFMDWSNRRGSRNYRFGFATPERLGQWFFGEADTLATLNMHVAVYEAPHQAVLRGDWQLAFRKQSATLIRTMELKGMVE